MAKVKEEITKFTASVNRIHDIIKYYEQDYDNQWISQESMNKQKKFRGRRYPENIRLRNG